MIDKNSGNNQKSITWSSPLITSPASNYSVKDNIEPENEAKYNKIILGLKHVIFVFSYRNKEKSQSPKFSIKFFDNSYSPSVPKTHLNAQQSHRVPIRKKTCKIQLADRNYNTQPQFSEYSDQIRQKYSDRYSELAFDNSSPSEILRKPVKPIQDFHYHSIKVFNTQRMANTLSPVSDRSDLSASTSSSLLNEKKSEPDVKEYRLKHFLSQFKKDEKTKMTLNGSSSQAATSKLNRLTDNIENYEQKPSCSKWRVSDVYPPAPLKAKEFFESSPPSNILPKRHTPSYAELHENYEHQPSYSQWNEYQPKDYYVYEPPSLKIKTSENLFESSPPSNILPKRQAENYEQPSYNKWSEYQPNDYYVYKPPPLKRKTPEAFFESSPHWNKENNLQRSHSPNFEVDLRHPYNYIRPSITNAEASPRRHYTETRPLMDFSNTPLSFPIPERSCHFTPHEENYFNRYSQPQRWKHSTHNQYFSQAPMQSFQATPRQCTHCSYCQAAPMMRQERTCPYFHCEPEEPF